ncbi:MAG: hypothetical protein EBS01_12210, partial [Verrucomicrobia bacterium]|nr:hypothetical protein [Verrucomicrobiota bacterium]
MPVKTTVLPGEQCVDKKIRDLLAPHNQTVFPLKPAIGFSIAVKNGGARLNLLHITHIQLGRPNRIHAPHDSTRQRAGHEQQHKEAMAKRRVGLGFTGLGDALAMLRLRYDTDEARAMAARISAAMRDEAYKASSELAR